MRTHGASTDPEEQRSILVADGDEDAASVLASLLLYQRFRAHATARGSEALRLARTHPLDLAVVDVRLQDMSGRELILGLRQIDHRLPVVVTSADLGAEAEGRARELGLLHYVHKPYDPRRIVAVVAKALARPGAPRARVHALGLRTWTSE